MINDANLENEPLWEKESTVIHSASIPLIVEVVSTNWEDDYYTKFGNYQAMKIPEYWIADYAALGGRKFIGNPKQPTFFACELIEDEYQMTAFRNDEQIISPAFQGINEDNASAKIPLAFGVFTTSLSTQERIFSTIYLRNLSNS